MRAATQKKLIEGVDYICSELGSPGPISRGTKSRCWKSSLLFLVPNLCSCASAARQNCWRSLGARAGGCARCCWASWSPSHLSGSPLNRWDPPRAARPRAARTPTKITPPESGARPHLALLREVTQEGGATLAASPSLPRSRKHGVVQPWGIQLNTHLFLFVQVGRGLRFSFR